MPEPEPGQPDHKGRELRMSKQRFLLIVALAGFTMTAVTAVSAGDLNGPAVRKALVGKTVYLSANGIVLPIAYRGNGTMSGRQQLSQL